MHPVEDDGRGGIESKEKWSGKSEAALPQNEDDTVEQCYIE